MTRLYQSFSIELTLAVVLAFGLVAFRIGRTLWKGKRVGFGWYVGAALLLIALAVILYLTVKAGNPAPAALPSPAAVSVQP